MTETTDQDLSKTVYTLIQTGPTTEPLSIQGLNRDVIFKVSVGAPGADDAGHFLEQGDLVSITLLVGEDLYAKGGKIAKTGG